MTNVFISYCREDVHRAGKIVKALESEGHTVWWDRGLRAGEAWRTEIEQQLDGAQIVLVCWSRFSTGTRGGFVRDEASRAGPRLLPVLLDRVRPPLGFGEVQSLDLTRWSGSNRSIEFRDVAAAIAARAVGEVAPAPKAPRFRAVRRFVVGGGLFTVAMGAAAALSSVPAVRASVCQLPVAQPALARACCEAGLTAKSLAHSDRYTAITISKPGYLRQSPNLSATEEAARLSSLERLPADATTLCQPLSDDQRLYGTNPQKLRFDCHSIGGGYTCAIEYVAVCELGERRLVETCDSYPPS